MSLQSRLNDRAARQHSIAMPFRVALLAALLGLGCAGFWFAVTGRRVPWLVVIVGAFGVQLVADGVTRRMIRSGTEG